MTDELTQAMLYGHYQDAPGADVNPIADAEKLYTDEISLTQRPSVMKRIGITAAGIVATAFYYQNQSKQLAIKALYALFAAGLGINIGIAAGDTRVDAAAAAAAYYGFTRASSRLNLTGQDGTLEYEALAGLAAGFAYDYYLRAYAQ